jgi:hypothetical protein
MEGPRDKRGDALFPGIGRSLTKGFAHDERTDLTRSMPRRHIAVEAPSDAGDRAWPLLSGCPLPDCAPKITVRAEPHPTESKTEDGYDWGTRRSEEGRGRSQSGIYFFEPGTPNRPVLGSLFDFPNGMALSAPYARRRYHPQSGSRHRSGDALFPASDPLGKIKYETENDDEDEDDRGSRAQKKYIPLCGSPSTLLAPSRSPIVIVLELVLVLGF